MGKRGRNLISAEQYRDKYWDIYCSLNSGQSIREIAAARGVSFQRIQQISVRLGIFPKDVRARAFEQVRSEICAMSKTNTTTQIASSLKVSLGFVHKVLKRHNLRAVVDKSRPLPAHAFVAKEMYERGATYMEIGCALGKGTMTIHGWCKRLGVKSRSRNCSTAFSTITATTSAIGRKP